VHGLVTNEPLLSDVNDTEPVGVFESDDVTVAVQVLTWSTVTDEGEQATVVVVVAPGTVTVNKNLPTLRP
jgi:hypothetical protein